MSFDLFSYNNPVKCNTLDISSLIGKSIKEIEEIVKKTIIIDDFQWIAKIVLTWLPNQWVFLWQTEIKNIKILTSISIDTIINNIDYSMPKNKLKN